MGGGHVTQLSRLQLLPAARHLHSASWCWASRHESAQSAARLLALRDSTPPNQLLLQIPLLSNKLFTGKLRVFIANVVAAVRQLGPTLEEGSAIADKRGASSKGELSESKPWS